MTDLMIDYQKELDRRTLEYHKIGREYASAKQVYMRMEDLKKTMLSKIKSEFMYKEKGKITAATLDTYGYSDKRYEDFIEELSKAREIYLDIEMRKEALKNRIDALITLVSLEKVKMQLA